MAKTRIGEYIGGRSCAVLGLGVSNLPLVRILLSEGACVTVYDRKTPEELGAEALSLRERGVRFVRADGSFDGICEQLIFRSPGIRPDVRGIEEAIKKGAELCSEMELFLKLTEARTFAITGSDGKTTTTTLAGKFLSAAGEGSTYVGGNIGEPLLDRCEDMTEKDNAVLELSSFQLMTLSDAPECVAITNVSPNHLDWHADMGEYVRAKENIIGSRTKRIVTNADCPETFRIACEAMEWEGAEVVLFSSEGHSYSDIYGNLASTAKTLAIYENGGYICISDGEREEKMLALCDVKLPGRHNAENFMTAIGLTYGCVPAQVYGDVAREFFGVEHRLEFVRRIDGVDFYNSSIDSSPTRTAAALSAMKGRTLVLICGGYDKKLDYAPLAKAIFDHGGVRAVSLTGNTGEKIRAEIERYAAEHKGAPEIKLEYNADFGAAVNAARAAAKVGDAVLLSPASASFDAFKNFAERGRVFRMIVNG